MKTPPFRSMAIAALWLAIVPGVVRAQFSDVTTGPLGDTGTSFGAAWGDCDKDGDLDLFFTNGSGQSKLLRNDGGAVFSDMYGGESVNGTGGDAGVVWGDYDDDGDLDLFVTSAVGPNRLHRNDAGQFNRVPAGAAAGTGLAQSAAWSDYDRDGDLDIYIGYWGTPNTLCRNDNGVFVNATPPALAVSSKSTGIGWADFDNDGDPDLYLGGHVVSHLFRNEGAGGFVDVSDGITGKAGVNGVAWGDYDNDGDLDLYLARELNSSRLLRNDTAAGSITFTDLYIAAVRDPGSGQGTTWLDYDNDADLDLFLVKAGSDNSQGASNRLMRNNGGDSFTDVSAGPVLAVANSRGVAAGDFDNDGSVDLYVANWGGANQLLRNNFGGPHWIQVRLVGTQSNSHGIGARVRVVAGGKVQYRDIQAGSGIYSMDAPVASFGLTWYVTTVNSIQVFWPSGLITDTTNVGVDVRITLREESQIGVPGDETPGVARLLTAWPNPFRAGTTITYDLSEPSPVQVFVVDPTGRLLRTLETSDRKDPGRYAVRWDGLGENGRPVAQGVYYYSLTARNYRRSFPVVLVR